jgi:phage terminase large subunit-like protein
MSFVIDSSGSTVCNCPIAFEYPELKRAVLQTHQRWRNAGWWSYDLLIERKGSGLSLIQDLQRQNIHPLPVNPEGDKVMRMVSPT